MPEIRLTITDDNGNRAQRVFRLEGDLNTLGQIEEAVEQFRHQALPDVEQTLLSQAQERFVAQEKKTRSDPPR